LNEINDFDVDKESNGRPFCTLSNKKAAGDTLLSNKKKEFEKNMKNRFSDFSRILLKILNTVKPELTTTSE